MMACAPGGVTLRKLLVAALLMFSSSAMASTRAAAPQPDVDFVRIFGGVGRDDSLQEIALAPDGSVFVGGYTHGPSLLGQPTADLAADVFVARFGTGGKFQWARLLKGTGDDFLFGLAAGPDNSVYASGYSASPVFEGIPNRGDYDAFIAKFDRDGNRVWVKTLGGTGQDIGQDVAVSPNGDIIVAGTTSSLTFQKLLTDGRDGFLGWFDADGNRKRLKLVQGPNDEFISALTVLGDESVVVAGSTRDDEAVDPDTDPFLARFSARGREMWQKAPPLAANQWVNDVASTSGGLYLAGYEESPGGETSPDVTLTRFGLNGSLSWKQVFVGAKLDLARAIVPADGELLIAGVGLRGKPLHNALGEPFYGDAMLVRVGLGGRLKHTYYLGGGGTDDEAADAVARRQDGLVYLGGDARADAFLGKHAEPAGQAFLVGLRLPGGSGGLSTRQAKGANRP